MNILMFIVNEVFCKRRIIIQRIYLNIFFFQFIIYLSGVYNKWDIIVSALMLNLDSNTYALIYVQIIIMFHIQTVRYCTRTNISDWI